MAHITNVLPKDDLPDSKSPDLILRHPTEDECIAIWNNTTTEWIDSLTHPLYLKECRFLTTVPLARDGGMTTWVLVHKDSVPNKRHILCSCETFRKHSLTTNTQGEFSDNIVHGIASVFCAPPYRRRGYAGRMMQELVKELYKWQTDKFSCIGTTLYSDIGKDYYAKLGWTPNITNSQVELPPKSVAWPPLAKVIMENDIDDICKRDEALVRFQMSVPADEIKSTRFTIIPNVDHMGWHIGKEQFATDYLFGKTPAAKGAIAGPRGRQVWATWVHRYYGHPDVEKSHNVLHILRLVVEADETATRLPRDAAKMPEKNVYEEQIELLKAVLQAAQAEAAEWRLDVVQLWDPTPLVLGMLKDSGLEYTVTEREKDHIASLLWYDRQGGISKEQPLWVNNEHYAWQ